MWLSSDGRVELRAPIETDADLLYADLVGTSVTDTLVWDGPQSLESYRQGLRTRAERVRAGEAHLFTIVERASGGPVGTIDVREEADGTWTAGLWIAPRAQGRGLGTSAVEAITRYGLQTLGLAAIEAHVFVGNHASRRIFEKNGYRLLGTRTAAVVKGGRPVDEWVLEVRVTA